MENYRTIDTDDFEDFNDLVETAIDEGFVISSSNGYWDFHSNTARYFALAIKPNNIGADMRFRDTVLEQLNDIKNVLKFINGNTKK